MKAVSYCRVSTEEQAHEGVSLAAQEARVRAYCAASGLSLVESIRDERVSAAKPLATRPGGAALLRALARRRAKHVVVVTLDRAFRSTLDCLATVQAWDRAGVSLHLRYGNDLPESGPDHLNYLFLRVQTTASQRTRCIQRPPITNHK
jgi:DNA invertase Pin-like site-specific DNA recombinase